MYIAAAAAVLSCYPMFVVDYVTDPRTGIASSQKFLPAIAEIKEACEIRQNSVLQETSRQQRVLNQLAAREVDENTRDGRKLSYDELKAKYGKDGWLTP